MIDAEIHERRDSLVKADSNPPWDGREIEQALKTAYEAIRAAEVLIKLEAREARLLGLDMPSKLEVTEEGNGIPLEALRELMNRADVEPIDVTPAPGGGRLLSNRKVPEDS